MIWRCVVSTVGYLKKKDKRSRVVQGGRAGSTPCASIVFCKPCGPSNLCGRPQGSLNPDPRLVRDFDWLDRSTLLSQRCIIFMCMGKIAILGRHEQSGHPGFGMSFTEWPIWLSAVVVLTFRLFHEINTPQNAFVWCDIPFPQSTPTTMFFKVLSGLVLAQVVVAQDYGGGATTPPTSASAAPPAPSAPADSAGHHNVCILSLRIYCLTDDFSDQRSRQW